MRIFLYLTSGLRLLTCVGKKETSRRPLCGTLRQNSNLSGKNHGIMWICVTSPNCIVTLRRRVLSVPILIRTLEVEGEIHGLSLMRWLSSFCINRRSLSFICQSFFSPFSLLVPWLLKALESFVALCTFEEIE